jgi:hypothetical protein
VRRTSRPLRITEQSRLAPRDVQQAVKRALHRDLIDVQYRPAATPEDLLDGLNDVRPHVVHFSGHAGDAAVLFDNAGVDSPQGHEVPFELLARALGATAEPPKLLVLNGCDTLDGAEVRLETTPVVIATATEISDLAASAFTARFYAAVASAQPIGPALHQGGSRAGPHGAWTRAGSPACSHATTSSPLTT